MNEPELIRSMLGTTSKEAPRTIAVIGLSEVPSKPSHYVSAYMQQHGYKIYPINPSIPEVLGEKSYASLSELPIKPDIVDEMIALGLTNLWVQQGIVNLEAATRAEAAGIQVVMDHCIMVEHRHR